MQLQSKQITLLAQYANQRIRDIRSYVCEDAINANNYFDYLKDVVTFGCASGIADRMVYYLDTHKFFDDNYQEIESLRTQYESMFGDTIFINGDLKNSLACFAYECIAKRVLKEIEQHL